MASNDALRIIMTDTITRAIEISDGELTELLDRYDAPAEAGQEPIDRFFAWTPTFEAERELRDLGDVEDEETEYDTE